MRLQFDAAPDELSVFLEEAEEQLQLLGQDILILEKKGADRDVLQEVFRAAHTLKGSSAAIGHARMASLTHAMEGVLDNLRKSRIDVTTSLVDLLLQGVDGLRILKEEVVTLNHSGFDPSPIVASLHSFLDNSLQLRVEASRCEARTPETNGFAMVAPDDAPGQPVYKVTVQVEKDAVFPAARFLQVHLLLSELGDIVESIPSREDLEEERVGSELQLAIATESDPEMVREMIMDVPEIAGVHLESQVSEKKTAFDRAAVDFGVLLPDLLRGEGISEGVGTACQEVENPVDRQQATKWVAHSKTVRIDIERLDALMNLVGELVIDCTRLVELSSRLQRLYEGEETTQNLGETSLHIQRITDELQDKIMKARMFPVSSVFSRFPRMIRDLAQRAGKKVEFVMEGEDTELDRSVIEEIGDPLIHLLRNAVDHGIETPDVRLSRGKPEVGVVRLTACHRENRIVLVAEDDGKGIDPARIRQVSIEKGIVTAEAAARMNDQECLEMIFMPGFSTAEQISDVSGRGVGMDIVRTNIHKLNGTVGIESASGRGTKFTMELPLTLAIMDALLVTLGADIFAIPLASVTETLRVHRDEVKSVNRGMVIQLRGSVLPLLALGEALAMLAGRGEKELDKAYVVVVGAENEKVGIVVDSLIGEQQVVIKSLGKYIGDIRGISGATILGDGRVALILDVSTLVKKRIQERVADVICV